MVPTPTHADLAYSHQHERNVLDIYLPTSVAGAPPLVVYIHGGAFRMGDKEGGGTGPIGVAAFLAAGFAVASVNYRLSQHAIWPAQLEDLRAAFDFLRKSAAELGFDASRIASFGDSAGGHLSAMVGIDLARHAETRLCATVVWYPPIDFPMMDEDMLATGVERASGRNDGAGSPESDLIGATVADHVDLAREASPITHLGRLPDTAILPRFLIMHGALDPLIAPQQSGRLFAALLARRPAPWLEYFLLPEGGHGKRQFQEAATMERVTGFLKSAFGETT